MLSPSHSSSSASITVNGIAEAIGGTLHGTGEKQILGIKPLELATESDLSFFAPTSKKSYGELFEKAKTSSAGALLIQNYEKSIPITQIVTPNPLQAVIAIANKVYSPPRPPIGIHPTAQVHSSVRLGKNVAISEYCVVGENCVLGDNVTLFPHSVLYAGVTLGENTIIHAHSVLREFITLGKDCLIQPGVVLGGDGFGYIPNPGKGHSRIPHVGTLILEDGVDIGANSTIDRATLGETRLSEQVKIDNLVMVGHNCQIGKRALLCGHVGISGSCEIGEDVILGGKVGLADHIKIVDHVRVAAGSGVTTDLEASGDYSGLPAVPSRTWRKMQVIMRNLPDLVARFRKIEDALLSRNRSKE